MPNPMTEQVEPWTCRRRPDLDASRQPCHDEREDTDAANESGASAPDRCDLHAVSVPSSPVGPQPQMAPCAPLGASTGRSSARVANHDHDKERTSSLSRWRPSVPDDGMGRHECRPSHRHTFSLRWAPGRADHAASPWSAGMGDLGGNHWPGFRGRASTHAVAAAGRCVPSSTR